MAVGNAAAASHPSRHRTNERLRIQCGAHFDAGGGYGPRAREKLRMTQPCKASVPTGQRVESHAAWTRAEADTKVLRESGVAREGYIVVKAWPAATNPRGKAASVMDYWITVLLERPVHGELSLIALRVLRELGVRQGVPFDVITDTDKRFKLPDELIPIAKQILQRVITDRLVKLEPAHEALLRARYIHMSAQWTPRGPFLLNKPAPLNRRNVHLNRPQEGYPE